MADAPHPLPVRILLFAWNAVDWGRRIATNALFVGVVLFLGVGLIVGIVAGGPKVPKQGALVVDLKGELVEQKTAGSPEEMFAEAFNDESHETLLKDVLDAVRLAKDDERINSLFLDLTHLSGAGLTKLEDLGHALAAFRKAGKKVIAFAPSYSQASYYLAAQADEVWLQPEGMVLFEGFGRWKTFFKDALDRLQVDVHVFKVGEYKSAVEPFIRNEPSEEAKTADAKWLGDLWRSWVKDVAAARKLTPEDVDAYIAKLPENTDAAKGDLAQLALDAKLVDKVGYRDEVRAKMISLAGADKDNKKEKTFRQVSVRDYLEFKGGDRKGAHGFGDAVAVIVAKGDIMDGKQPSGSIGGDSTAALVRKAREDEKVKAIVLRVDSGGGSAVASEVIRREFVLARKEGKKVVVSMGSVAASGGYWISTASDEIWASGETITGSIGIFGIFPTVDRTLSHFLGIRVDGVGTTPWSGALRPDRPLKPELGRLVQRAIEYGYEEFLKRVSEARKMTRDEVDHIARGRVWSGTDALERKLVDKLGSLDEAIASAAEMAQLPKGYRVWWVEQDKTFKERLAAALEQGQLRWARIFGGDAEEAADRDGSPVMRAVREQLGGVSQLFKLNDPNGLYAVCGCSY